MKKIVQILSIIIAVSVCMDTQAQINSFPATEGFEAAFDTGLNVVFIPNWTGNEVRGIFARIFADTVNFHGGAKALGMIPTGTFVPQVVVAFNLTGVSNMTTSFFAKSEANGGGTRSDVVYFSTSIDGGVTYGPATQIGDSTVFAAAPTPWVNYFYPFPANTNNQADVRLKMVVSRGNGSGTTARFIADDFTFIESTVDSFPPVVVSAKATSLNSVDVQFSEPLNVSAETIASYTGLTTITSAIRNGTQETVTLTLSTPLTLGQFYTLNIANVSDQNGIVMIVPQDFDIVFNNNIGNIKITEIMYNNPGNDSIEFVEIRNLDVNAINIGGWKFSDGLVLDFPSGTIIQPNQYLVFSRFPQVADTFYNITTIGWDGPGSLNNIGEKISISNTLDVIIDSVTYGYTAPWDTLANSYGYSLTLCNESADNDLAQNWTHSLDSVRTYSGIGIYANPGTGCIIIGVEETTNATQNNAISIQPNPSSSMCQIVFGADVKSNTRMVLTDVNGRELLNGVVGINTGTGYKINTSVFENGIYILRVGEHTAKLVVQH